MSENKNASVMNKEKKKKVFFKRFRLLPLVIFFCVLMLSVRVGVVWRSVIVPSSFEEHAAILSVTPVQAQSSAETNEKPAEATEETLKEDAAPDSLAGQVNNSGKSFSQSELEILQKLAQRREELDIRERTIEQKAGVLKAAEAQIDMKIAKLKELEASIKELVGVYNEKEKSRISNLVKIYSTMKPKEAARLFNDMEMSLLVRVFEQMKEAKAAPILALMDLTKANALTSELANKKKPPGLEEE